MPEIATIRAMGDHDLAQVLAWRNHPDVRAFMLNQHEIGPEEHRAWFERVQRERTRDLLIVESMGARIGFMQFSRPTAAGVSDWGFYAAPDAPPGSGRVLCTAALRHAFMRLDLRKVCGQALACNEASIRLHRALGFAQEGVLREQHSLRGEYHDLVCFGLLRKEWTPHEHS